MHSAGPSILFSAMGTPNLEHYSVANPSAKCSEVLHVPTTENHPGSVYYEAPFYCDETNFSAPSTAAKTFSADLRPKGVL